MCQSEYCARAGHDLGNRGHTSIIYHRGPAPRCERPVCIPCAWRRLVAALTCCKRVSVQSRDLYGLPLAPDSGTFVVSFLHETGNHTFSSVGHKAGGTVESVTIAAGGSSCTAAGTLGAKGGAGSGFAASFTISGGAINSVTVTNTGEGYIFEPILWIDSGGAGCTGYSLQPVIAPAGDYFFTAVTTVSGKYRASPLLVDGRGLNASYFNNVWLHGAPAISRVDRTIDFDWGNGPITPHAADRASVRWEGTIQVSPSIPQAVAGLRGGVRKVDVISPGTSCTADGTLTASGGGGSGFEASFSVASYIRADGTFATGIDKITITNPGSQYTSAPDLTIATGGAGCTKFRFLPLLSSTNGMDVTFYSETDGYAHQLLQVPLRSCRAPPLL